MGIDMAGSIQGGRVCAGQYKSEENLNLRVSNLLKLYSVIS